MYNLSRNRYAEEALKPFHESVNRDERPYACVHSLRLRRLARNVGDQVDSSAKGVEKEFAEPLRWGQLYYYIAWLLTGFMVGAAGGAAVGTVLKTFKECKQKAALFCDGLMACLLLGTMGIFALEWIPVWIFGALMLITGGVTGVAVPLVWLPQLGITWTCVLLLCFKLPLLVKKREKNPPF